ncbi:MAG: preprotein translocase subunit SecE [Planctomycetota bacterium]
MISVEAEMNKVSWPSKTERWRATAGVMFVIFALSVRLFLFDAIWSYLFKLLNIRYLG